MVVDHLTRRPSVNHHGLSMESLMGGWWYRLVVMCAEYTMLYRYIMIYIYICVYIYIHTYMCESEWFVNIQVHLLHPWNPMDPNSRGKATMKTIPNNSPSWSFRAQSLHEETWRVWIHHRFITWILRDMALSESKVPPMLMVYQLSSLFLL